MKNAIVMIRLFDWDQVVALCDLRVGGVVRVDTVGDDDVEFDADVIVELFLPDGFRMNLGGRVVALKPASIGGPIIPVVELTSFTHARARTLRALALPRTGTVDALAMVPRRRVTAPRSPSSVVAVPAARGSDLAVSELIRGNSRLRQQIDHLAAQMRPADDD